MSEEKFSAFGELVEPEDPLDIWYVPPEERLDSDDDQSANALGPDDDGVDTGDDTQDLDDV